MQRSANAVVPDCCIQVLSEFTGQPPPYQVWAQEFEVEPLGEELALLIY